ncbi:MAG: TRASH domain protein [Acidobacteria bacterium]|nr:TRASH domain protein [Acidobacteriota bacterium]
MLRVLVFLVLIYLVARALWRLVYGIAEGLSGADRKSPTAMPLVRDPVCGTYVVPSRALTAGSGRDVQFFCSERCRQKWTSR